MPPVADWSACVACPVCRDKMAPAICRRVTLRPNWLIANANTRIRPFRVCRCWGSRLVLPTSRVFHLGCAARRHVGPTNTPCRQRLCSGQRRQGLLQADTSAAGNAPAPASAFDDADEELIPAGTAYDGFVFRCALFFFRPCLSGAADSGIEGAMVVPLCVAAAR